MMVPKTIVKIVGKENLQIDSAIGIFYIIHQCLKYGCMMVRGRFFAMGYKKISNNTFVGKKVKVLDKRNLSVGSKTKIHDGVYIDALSEEGVLLGDGVVIGRNCRLECTGTIKSIGKGIRIGKRSSFGNDCFFGAAGGVMIGDDVVAGQYVRFHSENHNYNNINILIKEQGVSHKGIKIGNDCWIGAGAVFLDGAELGDGCVVGANAVVTERFANNCVIGGVPAKLIKYRGICGEQINNNNCSDL